MVFELRPSDLKVYEACPRKYELLHVIGSPPGEPEDESSFYRGNLCHTLFEAPEAWNPDDFEDDIRAAARIIKQMWAAIGPGALSITRETKLHGLIGGVPVTGTPDLVVEYVDRIVIYDLKTTTKKYPRACVLYTQPLVYLELVAATTTKNVEFQFLPIYFASGKEPVWLRDDFLLVRRRKDIIVPRVVHMARSIREGLFYTRPSSEACWRCPGWSSCFPS